MRLNDQDAKEIVTKTVDGDGDGDGAGQIGDSKKDEEEEVYFPSSLGVKWRGGIVLSLHCIALCRSVLASVGWRLVGMMLTRICSLCTVERCSFLGGFWLWWFVPWGVDTPGILL